LLIGPWSHIAAGPGLPSDGVPALASLALQLFDEHVLGLVTGAGCRRSRSAFGGRRGHGRPGRQPLRVTIAAYDVPHALPPAPAAASTLAGRVEVLNDARHPSSVVVPVVATAAPLLATAPADEAVAFGGRRSRGRPQLSSGITG
jgi:hypothetical protein